MADRAFLSWNDKQLLEQLLQLSIDELQQLVRYHNTAYFQQDSPRISDAVFDRLVRQLQLLAPQSSVLQEIGGGFSVTAHTSTITHSSPMLSLDKCYDESDLVAWHEKMQDDLIVMPKIDGLACALRYTENGALQLAATRGDGVRGEDVTQNIKGIGDIPTQLDEHMCKTALASGQRLIEVRGEVYMSKTRFAKHYANQFANPRNLAAGALKQKDAGKSADYGLSFFAYDILGSRFTTQFENFGLLQQFGFTVAQHRLVRNKQELLDTCAFFVDRREHLHYEVDGIVFRVNIT